jgi:hypothetical protein
MRAFHLILVATLAIAGCDGSGGSTSTAKVGGSVAVGIGTGGAYDANDHGGSGPPPGRTAQERAARQAYYRGPRGEEW